MVGVYPGLVAQMPRIQHLIFLPDGGAIGFLLEVWEESESALVPSGGIGWHRVPSGAIGCHRVLLVAQSACSGARALVPPYVAAMGSAQTCDGLPPSAAGIAQEKTSYPGVRVYAGII